MFFVLSKLLLVFILPFTWIAVCLITSLIVRKPHLKRRFFITGMVLMLIFTSPFLMNQFAKLWDIKPVPLKNQTYSCVIVLGGFSGVDANGEGVFNQSSDRFIQSLKLVTTGKATHILISGGNGNLLAGSFRESDWVKTQLEQLKVPDSLIVIENQSRNTLENAAFSKSILAQKHLQPPYLLVTSAFHMRRAIAIFKKQKMDVVPFPCCYIAGNGEFTITDFIPDADPLSTWNFYVKEVVGHTVNYFK
ncbi:YdcF family protein [Mucilaginibacter flavidus]|uniref:YdcF family protein n=1 Tax=Mucilaginibacter flavidus TaxID=2949309 RepID=UPI002093D43D|nr:YdcF family protein [Mucilaginibacter flavidus]MCO5948661.1 YdcF family protein [Mucilaginibacter flavidus]